MIKKLLKINLLLAAFALVSCQPEREEDKGSFSETHPKLEKQLDKRSVKTPISDSENPELYQRYQITMEEYQRSGNYHEANMYRGRFAPLDEKSHPDAIKHKDALNRGMEEGVNFAGKYTIVSINCGENCQTHYVIDRESGMVMDKIQSSAGAVYKPNSKLFVINPPSEDINYSGCSTCAPKAYLFENGQFRKLPLPKSESPQTSN